MKKRLTILAFMLFALVGGLFGCASPYSKTEIVVTSSLMQNGAIEITRDITDEELNVITLTSTVTNAPKEASTDSVFISSKPEVVSVVETVNVTTGVTEAKLVAKSAGEVIIRVRTEGKSKDVKITVLEGVRDIRFADDYAPAFYRGTENEINENKILYNLNSTQPSIKNRGVSFAFVGDNTNNKIGIIEGNKVTLNPSYAGSTLKIRATSLTNPDATSDITIKVYDDIDLSKISVSLLEDYADLITYDNQTGTYGMIANNNNKNKAEFLVSYPNKSTSYKYLFAFSSVADGIASVEEVINSSTQNSSVSNLTVRANGYGVTSIYGKIYIEGHYGEAKTFVISVKSDLEPTLLKILSAEGAEVGEDVEIYAGGYRSYVGAFVYPSVVASEQKVKVYIPSSVIYIDNGDGTYSGFVDVYSSANGNEKLALTLEGSYAVAEILSSDAVYFAINPNAVTAGNLGSFDISFEVVNYEHLARTVRIRPAIAIESINVESIYVGSENVLYVSNGKYFVEASLTTNDEASIFNAILSIAPARASKVSLGVRVYNADSLFNVIEGNAPIEVVNFSSEALVGSLRAVNSGFAVVEFYSNTTSTRVYVTIYKQIENISIGVSSYENITEIKADANGVITEFAVSQGRTAQLNLNVTPIDSAEFVKLGIVQMDGVSVAGATTDDVIVTYDNGDLELVYNTLDRSIKVTPKASKTTNVSLIISGAGSAYIVNFGVVSFVAIDAGSVALLDAKGQKVTFINTYLSETVGLYNVASKSTTEFAFTFAGVEGFSLAGDYEVNFELSNNLYGDLAVDGLNATFTANRWPASNYGNVGTCTLTASVTQHGVTYESKVLIYVNKAVQTSSVTFTNLSNFEYRTKAQMASGLNLSTSVATTNSHNKNVSYVVLNSAGNVLINTLAEKLSYGEGNSIVLEGVNLTSSIAGEFTIIAFTDDSITSSFDVKNLTNIDVNNLPVSLVYAVSTIYVADGSELNPYMVYTADDFNSMTAENFYRLGSNISLAYSSSDNMVSSVAGLDGNGYIVSYTSSAFANGGYAGLIYNANGSNVKNLTVNAQITLAGINDDNVYIGGLFGNATNVTVENVTVNAKITLAGNATNAYVGGLAGMITYTGSNEGVIDSPVVTGFINTSSLTSNLVRGAIVGSISAEVSARILAPYYTVEGTIIAAGNTQNVTIENFNKATIESFSVAFNDQANHGTARLEKYSNSKMIVYLDSVSSQANLNSLVTKTVSPVGDGIRYNYSYSSSDSDIASVDANGLITFKGFGLVTLTISVTAGDNTLSQMLEFFVLPVGYLALYDGDTQVVKFNKTNSYTFQAKYGTTQGFTLKLVDNNGNIVENFKNFVNFKVGGEFLDSFAVEVGNSSTTEIKLFANIMFSDETITSKVYENGLNTLSVTANADTSAFDATATISKSNFNINENVTLDVTLHTYDDEDSIRVQIYKNGANASSKFVFTEISSDDFANNEISATYNISVANYLGLSKAERQAVYGNYEIRILGKTIVGQTDKVLKVINVTINPAMLTSVDLLNYASESIKADTGTTNGNAYDINEEPTDYIYLGYSSLIKVHLTAENADISEISVTSSSEHAVVSQYYLTINGLTASLTKEDGVTPITGGFKTTKISSSPSEYNGWIYVRVSLSANYSGASNIVITVKAVQENGNTITKSISLTPVDKIDLSVTGSTYVADRTEFELTFKAQKTLDYAELNNVALSGQIPASAGTLNLVSIDESTQSAKFIISGATLGSNIDITFTYSRTFMGIVSKVSATHTIQVVKYVIDGLKFVANYGLVDKYGDSIEYEISNYSVVAYNQFIPGIRLTGTWSKTYDAEVIAFENALNNFAISSYSKDGRQISSIFTGKSGSVLELGKTSDEYLVYKDLTNRSVRKGGNGFTTIQMMSIVPQVTTSSAAVNAQVRYYYENGNFFIVVTGAVGAYRVFGLKDGAYKSFDSNYGYANSVLNKTLTFAIEANSSTDSPIPVTTLDELISLNSAGNNLILNNDIYVTSLTPINAEFASLDGNNHNIYIYPNAFDGYVGDLVEAKYINNNNTEDDDKTLGNNGKANIGFFSTIGKDSIVKNLSIKLFEKGDASYVNSNGELIEYTEGGIKLYNLAGDLFEGEGIKAEQGLEISFGLLAGANYGSITNCSISYYGSNENSIDNSGELLDSANGYYNLENGIKYSYYFRSLDTNAPSGGNIGTLVGSNEGYLTNSRSQVSLIVANIDKYSASTIVGSSANAISTVSGMVGSYNVGGLVGINKRTISSSYYKNANILSFFNSPSLIGGFVGVNDVSTTEDSAVINLSYVEGGFITNPPEAEEWKYGKAPDEFHRADANFIITSGTVGGFVAVNNGLVSNSYSNIDLTTVSGSGNSSPSYAGFVHTNSSGARIEFSYTTSNILLNNETIAPFVGRTSMGENNSGEIYNCYTLEFGRVEGGYSKAQAYVTELSAEEFSIETSFNGFSFEVKGGASRSEAASWELPSIVNPGEIGSKTVYMHVSDTTDFIYNGTQDVTLADKLYTITFVSRQADLGNERASAYYSYKPHYISKDDDQRKSLGITLTEYSYNDKGEYVGEGTGTHRVVYYYVGEGNGTHRVERAIKTLVYSGNVYYNAVVIGKPNLVEANTIAKSQRVETARVQTGEGDQIITTYYFSYIEDSLQGLEPLGNKTNPIIITSIEEFSEKLQNGALGYGKKGNDYYYRLIRDIAFDDSTVSPATSNITFYGILSGNGMTISNARINQVVSDESDVNEAMGLFGKIVGTNEIQAETNTPAIRGAGVSDLTIEVSEMYANTYVYVGALAGLVEDAQVYNVAIEQTSSESTIVYGRNIVGGVIGYAVGDTQISNITSNLSAMSSYGRAERAGAFEDYSTINEFRSTSDRYNEDKFELKNDKIVSHLGEFDWVNRDDQGDSTVSYVGGLIGVADIFYEIQYKQLEDSEDYGFVRKPSSFYIWSSAYKLPSTSYGILKGAYVGGLVGYNASSTTISDCEYEVKGYRASQIEQEQRIEARDVAGGLVAENRGKIYNSRFVNLHEIDNAIASSGIEDDTSYFGNYDELSSVGVSNADIKIDTGVFNSSVAKIVGGMVGLNDGGLIVNSFVTASVKATKSRITGGVVGVNVAGSLKNVYITGTVIGKSNENSIQKWVGGVIGLNTTYVESLGITANMALQNIYAFNAWEEEATNVYEKSISPNEKITMGAIMGQNTNEDIFLFVSGSNSIADGSQGSTAQRLINSANPVIFYLDVMNYQNFRDNSSNFVFIKLMGEDTNEGTITGSGPFRLSQVSVQTNGDIQNPVVSEDANGYPILINKVWEDADYEAGKETIKNSAINKNLDEFFINDDEIDKTFSYYQKAIYKNLLLDTERCWSLDELRVLPVVKITNQPLGSEDRPYQIISQHTFETFVGFSAARTERTYFEVARDFEIDTTYTGNLDLTNAELNGCGYTITVHSSLFNQIDEYSKVYNLNIRVAGTDENGNEWIINPAPDYNNGDEYYWGALCNRLYGEANNVNLVDDSVINIALTAGETASPASLYQTASYKGNVAYAALPTRAVNSFIGGLVGKVEDGAMANALYSFRLDKTISRVGAVMNVTTQMPKNKISTHGLYLGGMIGHVSGNGTLTGSYSEKTTINLIENDVTGGTATLSLIMGGVVGGEYSNKIVNVNTYNTKVNATLNGGNYSESFYVGGTYGYLGGQYNSNTANDVKIIFNKHSKGLNIYAGGLAGYAQGLRSSYFGLDKAVYPDLTKDPEGNHANGLRMLGNVSVENNGSSYIRANIGGVFGTANGSVTLFSNIDKEQYQANTNAKLSAEGLIHSYIGGLIGFGSLSASNVHLENVAIKANGTQGNYVGGFAGEWQLNGTSVIDSSASVNFTQTVATVKNLVGGVCGSMWTAGSASNANATITNFTTSYPNGVSLKTNTPSTDAIANKDNVGGLIGGVSGRTDRLTITGNNVINGFDVSSTATNLRVGYGIGKITNLANGLIDIGGANKDLDISYNQGGTLNAGGVVGLVESSTFAISKSTNVELNIMAYANNATNTLNIGGVVGCATGSNKSIYVGYDASYTSVSDNITLNNDIILGVQSEKSNLYLGGVVGKAEQNINISKTTTSGLVKLRNAERKTFGITWYDLTSNNAVFNNASTYIGGLVGYNSSMNSAVLAIKNNSTNTRSIDVTANYVGGAVGNNSGTLNIGENGSSNYGFINNGAITTTGKYVGGVIGREWHYLNTVYKAKNTGEITSTNVEGCAGGIVGYSYADKAVTYESVENSGLIKSKHRVGGIIGWVNNSTNIKNSTNTGSIRTITEGVTQTQSIGGLVGYSNKQLTCKGCSNTAYIYQGQSDERLVYLGGLLGNNSTSSSVTIYESSVTGGGVENNSTNLKSATGNVIGLAEGVVNVYLTTVNCSNYAYYNVGGVVGKLTSNNSEIHWDTNVKGTISATLGQAGGIIGTYAATGTVSIGKILVEGKVSGYRSGGVVGQIADGNVNFYNSTVSSITATIENKSSGFYAGGAIGEIIGDAYVTFADAFVGLDLAGTVTAVQAAGGFIGYSNTSYTTKQQVIPSTVVNRGTIGSTTGTAVAGGIIGINEKGNYLINAQNTGSVTSTTQAGGIVGLVNAGTITLETAINTGKIMQAATSGSNATLPYSAGGIVGAISGGTVNVYNCLNGMSADGTVAGGEVTTVMFNTSGTYYTANTDAIIHLGGIIGYVGEASVTIDNHTDYDSYNYMTKNYGEVNNFALNGETYTGGIVGYINEPKAPTGKGLKAQNFGRIFSLVGAAGGLVAGINATTNFSTENRFKIWSSSTRNYGDVYSLSSKALLEDGTEAGSKFINQTNGYYYGSSAAGIVASVHGYLLLEGVSNGIDTVDQTKICALSSAAGFISSIYDDADVLLTYYGFNWAYVDSYWSNAAGFIVTLYGKVTFADTYTSGATEHKTSFVNLGTIPNDYFAAGVISQCLKGGVAILNNVTNEGLVTGYGYQTYDVCGGAGGIIALVSGEATINNCHNNGTVIGGNSGGIVGQNIVDSAHADQAYLSGYGTITINNSSNTGNVYASGGGAGGAGGIMGYVHTSSGEGSATITNCSNTGTVTAPEKAGGAVGWVVGNTTITGFTHSGNNAYVRANGTYARTTGNGSSYYCGAAGGVVGHVEGSVSIDNATISADVQSAGSAQGQWSGAGGIIGVYNWGTLTFGELNVSSTIGGYVVDSTNKTVQSAGGLIGRANSTIPEITSDTEFTFTGTIQMTNAAGGLVGRVNSATIDATNMTFGGTISGYNYAGGVMGMLASGTLSISNARNTATVNTTVTSATMTQTSQAQSTAGGIIGGLNSDGNSARSATLTNCSNAGTVTGATSAGGAIGLTWYGVTIDNFATTSTSVVKANGGTITANGTAHSSSGSSGGLVGILNGPLTIKTSASIAGQVFSAGSTQMNYSGAGGLLGVVGSAVTFDSSIDSASDITVSATIGGESSSKEVSIAGGLFGKIYSSSVVYSIKYARVTGTIQNANTASGGFIGASYDGAKIGFLEQSTSSTNLSLRNSCVIKATSGGSAGGFIGAYSSSSSSDDCLYFPKCVSTATSIQSSAGNVGGFVGSLALTNAGAQFIDVITAVNLTSNATSMGGLIGKANINDGSATLIISNALTDIVIGASKTSFGTNAGGAIGHLLNTGTVTVTKYNVGSGLEHAFVNNSTGRGTASIYGINAGGVIGLYDPAANAQLTVGVNDINELTVHGGTAGGGVIGMINDTNTNGLSNAPVVANDGSVTTPASLIRVGGKTGASDIRASITGQSVGGVIGNIISAQYVTLGLFDVYSAVQGTTNAGGLVGVANGNHLVFVSNRLNSSEISTSSDLGVAGGFVGVADGKVYIDSTNVNTSEATVISDIAGGYVGRVNTNGHLEIYGDSSAYKLDNNASVSGLTAGGFVGSTKGKTILVYCNNEATISATGRYFNNTNYAGNAGGLIGAASGFNTPTSATYFVDLSGCVNNGSIESTHYAGGMISQFQGLSSTVADYCLIDFTNCTNRGPVSSTTAGCDSGGFIGIMLYGKTTIDSSNTNTGAISSQGGAGSYVGSVQSNSNVILSHISSSANVTGAQVGGLVGVNYCARLEIENSIYTGTLTIVSASNVRCCGGGILGYAYSSETAGAYYTSFDTVNGGASLTSIFTVGGLIGKVESMHTDIANSLTSSSVTIANTNSSYGHAGGIIGDITDATVNIISTLNEATVTGGSYGYIGGFVGCVTDTAILNIGDALNKIKSFNYGSVSGDATNAQVGGFVGYAHSANISIYGENFGTISSSGRAGGYIGSYDGTEGSTITIDGANNGSISGTGDLGGFIGYATNVTIDMVLASNSADITSTTSDKYVGGLIAEIYSATANLSGFNQGAMKGASYTGGFVAYSSYSTINIVDADNMGAIDATTSYAGGFVGYLAYSNLTMDGCDNTGEVKTANYAGGLVGYAYTGTSYTASFESCTSDASITGNYAGGIIGYSVININMEYCTVGAQGTGNTITGTTYAGGLAGATSGRASLVVKNCSNYQSVMGDIRSGGLIGHAYVNKLEMSVNENLGVISIDETNISSTTRYIGGLVGYLYVASGSAVISSSTNNSYISQSITSAAVYGGGLIGYLSLSANVTISGCDVTGSINLGTETIYSTAYSYAGGLVGRSMGSSYTLTVTSSNVSGWNIVGDYAGGLIGYNTCIVNIGGAQSSSTGVSGKYAGGVIGYHSNSNTSNIIGGNNYFSVNGIPKRTSNTSDGYDSADYKQSYAGGVIGYMTGYMHFNMSDKHGNVWANNGGCAGGLVGYGTSATIKLTYVWVYGDVGWWNPHSRYYSAITYYAGGFFGYLNSCTVTTTPTGNIKYIGDVFGEKFSGGIVGYAKNGSMTFSAATIVAARIGTDGAYYIDGIASVIGQFDGGSASFGAITFKGYSEYNGALKRNGVIYHQNSDVTSTQIVSRGLNGATISRGTLTWTPTSYEASD